MQITQCLVLTCRMHASRVRHMAKSIQVRNVPDAVHRRLTSLAAKTGMSLSEFLLAEIADLAALPTADEMRDRLRARKSVKLAGSATAAIRKARDMA